MDYRSLPVMGTASLGLRNRVVNVSNDEDWNSHRLKKILLLNPL